MIVLDLVTHLRPDDLQPGQPSNPTARDGRTVLTDAHREVAKAILRPSVESRRLAALEALWSSIKNREDWKLGYNAKFTDACDALREIERGDIQRSSLEAQGLHVRNRCQTTRIENWSNPGGRDPGDENDSKTTTDLQIGSPS